MPRKKAQAAATTTDLQTTSPLPLSASDEADGTNETGNLTGRLPARSYRPSLRLAEKGVTIGVRDGHDWVLSFPGDPGKSVKDPMAAVGFAYRDRKWKIFTNVANRSRVESLVKELRRQLGDEISVNEFAVKQVVLAFDSPPGDDITAQLREAGFFFRADRTWNANYTPENQRFAYDFVKELPNVERSAARSA